MYYNSYSVLFYYSFFFFLITLVVVMVPHNSSCKNLRDESQFRRIRTRCRVSSSPFRSSGNNGDRGEITREAHPFSSFASLFTSLKNSTRWLTLSSRLSSIRLRLVSVSLSPLLVLPVMFVVPRSQLRRSKLLLFGDSFSLSLSLCLSFSLSQKSHSPVFTRSLALKSLAFSQRGKRVRDNSCFRTWFMSPDVLSLSFFSPVYRRRPV